MPRARPGFPDFRKIPAGSAALTGDEAALRYAAGRPAGPIRNGGKATRVGRKQGKYEAAVNLICLMALSAIILYFLLYWTGIPDSVPGHYNALGEADRWSGKGELLLLPILGWILFIGMTVIGRFPQVWNTGVAVTGENRVRVYGILRNMLATVKLITVFTFVCLSVNSLAAKDLPFWFLPLFLVLMFGSILFFVVKLVRAR